MLNEARVKPFGWLLLAPVFLGAAFGIVGLWRDETRAVRGRVQAAAQALSPGAGEADLNRLTRLAGFAKMLATDVLVEAEAGGPALRGREAVAGLAAQLSAAAGARRIEISDIEVTFDDRQARAMVTAVAHVASSSPGAAERTYDGQVIRLELTKVDGEWLISRARPEPALDR